MRHQALGLSPKIVYLQVDLDLGNYERFLDITLTRDNNLTTGKVYQVHPASSLALRYAVASHTISIWYQQTSVIVPALSLHACMQSVIERERRGDYLGKTVQVVPHITDAIQDWIERVAHVGVDGRDGPPTVCVIELGGTVGDIESMPFIEALRQVTFLAFICVLSILQIAHPPALLRV